MAEPSDVVASKLANPASYFCANVDCPRHVLSEASRGVFAHLDEHGNTYRCTFQSHRFVGPSGLVRVCDVCRSALELVTESIPAVGERDPNED